MRLTTFTVEFEVGAETRAFLERLAQNTPRVELELGPRTRELLATLAVGKPGASGGALQKLANVYRHART